MKSKKAFTLALGGICLALTIIFMFAGSFAVGIELTLFAISSMFVAVMIIESGIGGGIILYIAAVIMGLMLVPNKVAIVPYAFFFGYYGIVKYLIEKLPNAAAQIIVKVAFFAVVLSVGLLGFKELLLEAIEMPVFPAAVLIIGGTLMLMLYDYIFTLVINIYMVKIKRKGADNFKLS